MKVGELITYLRQWPQDDEVHVEADGQRSVVEDVTYDPAYNKPLVVILSTAVDEQ